MQSSCSLPFCYINIKTNFCSTGTISTRGFTKLRQVANLNETQVKSNSYLLRCKTELNILCTFLDKHNILIMVKLASYLCAHLIIELASVSLTEARDVPSKLMRIELNNRELPFL